ncbi:MAG: hypothetical protein QXR27_04345 [Archaeoglobaceae archaeon]
MKNKLDLSEFKILIPKAVINELKMLEEKLSGNEKIAAKIALKVVEKAEVIDSREGDEGIIEVARKFDCILVTNDRELRKKAEKFGIRTGYIKFGKVILSDY